MRTFAAAVGEADQFLRPFRCRADDDENALRLVFQTRLQMDAIGPDVDIALGREVALGPSRIIVVPAFLQPTDRRRRKSWRILAEQGRQRLREVAGRDALEVQDRQQRLDRLRASHVGRQDH